MPVAAFRNTFAGNPLDRSADRRTDKPWLDAQLQGSQAKVYALWNGSVLVKAEQAMLAEVEPDLGRALGADGDRLLFLGRGPDGTAVFALDLEGPADPTAGPMEGLGQFQGLRELASVLTPDEAAIAATARAMFEWGRRTRFCPACGARLAVADRGWRRTCTACGVDQFPRTDPVVIMLPVRGDRCLLGRQASWPPGRYSALAGFMEPGESIEEACAREIAEESGLAVTSVSYHSSQPWPFPANLMIGLIAEVADGEAAPNDSELEAVRWVSRTDMRQVLAAQSDDWPSGPAATSVEPPGRSEPDIGLPPPLAIARQLIESWARGALEPARDA